MNQSTQDPETERFYKLSYFIIPIPMLLGLAFAAYVLMTEDSRNLSYCTVSKSEQAYQKPILQAVDFVSHEAISLNLCKDKDENIDAGDGQLQGRVHWFVCKGTTCGPHWQTLLALPQP
ncbi:MAG: hypothetical protein Q9M19_07460 [Mariprofundaceae bacterium]|nr:hypothetical protein [Mariprofundaceae bacterium]